MTKQLKADMALVLVTFMWGVAYVPMSLALETMKPYSLTAIRFTIAFALTYLLTFKKMKNISKQTIAYSAVLGFLLTCAYTGANFGVMYTSVSNAAFLCALAVVITPVLVFIINKKKPDNRLYAAIALSVVGVAMMSFKGSLTISTGDLFCIFCSLSYSFNLTITEKAVSDSRVDPLQVGVMQLLFCAIYNIIITLVLEREPMPQGSYLWGLILFMAVFGTALTFVTQVIAQKYTTASHVGVIFTLEPLFGAAAAFFVMGERMTTLAVFGAAVMMMGLVVMEMPGRRKKSEHSDLR